MGFCSRIFNHRDHEAHEDVASAGRKRHVVGGEIIFAFFAQCGQGGAENPEGEIFSTKTAKVEAASPPLAFLAVLALYVAKSLHPMLYWG